MAMMQSDLDVLITIGRILIKMKLKRIYLLYANYPHKTQNERLDATWEFITVLKHLILEITDFIKYYKRTIDNLKQHAPWLSDNDLDLIKNIFNNIISSTPQLKYFEYEKRLSFFRKMRNGWAHSYQFKTQKLFTFKSFRTELANSNLTLCDVLTFAYMCSYYADTINTIIFKNKYYGKINNGISLTLEPVSGEYYKPSPIKYNKKQLTMAHIDYMSESFFGANVISRKPNQFRIKKSNSTIDDVLMHSSSLYDLRYIVLEFTKFSELVSALEISPTPKFMKHISKYLDYRDQFSAHPSADIITSIEEFKSKNFHNYMADDIAEIMDITYQIIKSEITNPKLYINNCENYTPIFQSDDQMIRTRLPIKIFNNEFLKSMSDELRQHIAIVNGTIDANRKHFRFKS